MAREKFTIELDREEALMLVFLSSSSGSENSRMQLAVDSVAQCLRTADPTLQEEQGRMWIRAEKPLFDLSAGPEAEEG